MGTLWLVSLLITFTWTIGLFTPSVQVAVCADLLVPVGGERHGEPPPVLGEDGRLLELEPAAGRGHHQAVPAVALQRLAHAHHAAAGRGSGDTQLYGMMTRTCSSGVCSPK